MFKKLMMLITTVILVCNAGLAVFAEELPDFNEVGNIEISMRQGNTVVTGGSLTMYYVGEIVPQDDTYRFQAAGEFEDCGYSFTVISSRDLARNLSSYATAHHCTGTTVKIDNNGHASFSDLSLGLYLFVQNETAENYSPVTPFLVSVPQIEEGNYVYQVDASPKISFDALDPNNPNSTPPPNKLPQTGQLNWPIPVLAVSGLILITIGIKLRSDKKDVQNET